MKNIIIIIFLLTVLKANSQHDGCWGISTWSDISPLGANDEVMKFTDGTFPKCVRDKKFAFNNGGLGIMVGYKDGGVLGRRVIYKFVIYKSTDGLHWSELKNDEISTLLTDTLDTPPFLPSYQLYSNENKIYLYYKDRKGIVNWFYSTSQGEKWERETFQDAKGNYFKPNFVNSPDNLFPYYNLMSKVPNSVYFKSGNQWSLYNPDWNGMWGPQMIPIHIGRQVKFHNYDGYYYAGKKFPYYKFDKNVYNANKSLLVMKLGSYESPSHEFEAAGHYIEHAYPEAVFMSKTNPLIQYADFGHFGIFKSVDGGKSFKIAINRVYRIYPICDDGTIFFVNKDTDKRMKILKSSDGFMTWQPITDILSASMGEVDILPNGSVVVILQHGAFKLKETCGSNIKEPEYGTTIITHGWQLDGEAPTNENDWAFQMALEIIKKHGKGIIKEYNKDTGSFVSKKIIGEGGEVVLIYDWAEESNDNVPGYSEAAGDALFAALMLGQKKGNIKLENLHFIGHSRGCVVNTECVERLLTIGLKVDHVTNLDPHDWGGGANLGLNVSNDWDNHPNLNIQYPKEPRDTRPNNGVIAWEGIKFVDTYWQFNPLYTANLLDGRPVDGAANFDWNSYSTGHINIHDTYIQTINDKLPSKAGGFGFSKLGIEFNNRPLPNSPQPNKYSISFDFFNNMIGPGSQNRIRGIMNGGFDRGGNDNLAILPGWLFHGGLVHGESVIFSGDKVTMKVSINNNVANPILRHNRFFVPKNANSIAFKYKSLKNDAGMLKVTVSSQSNKSVFLSKEFPFNKQSTDFIDCLIDVSKFNNDVVVIEFELTAQGNQFPSIELDDVKFSRQVFEAKEKTFPNANSTSNKDKELSAVFHDNYVPLKPFNGGFNDEYNWTYSGGTLTFENGTVSLQPEKKNNSVILKHSAFELPLGSKKLQLKFDKSKVGEADLSIIILCEGKEDEIHIEKIRQTVNKISDGISVFDKALRTGELPPKDETKEKFEVKEIDISKFSGKVVELELKYKVLGLGKPKLAIDEITIK